MVKRAGDLFFESLLLLLFPSFTSLASEHSHSYVNLPSHHDEHRLTLSSVPLAESTHIFRPHSSIKHGQHPQHFPRRRLPRGWRSAARDSSSRDEAGEGERFVSLSYFPSAELGGRADFDLFLRFRRTEILIRVHASALNSTFVFFSFAHRRRIIRS